MSALAVLRPQSGAETPEAYAADLYRRHHRTIFRLCLSQLRRREDADDAVQTTFIYALLSLRRGVEPQLELPWLMTIAKNACSTRRRSGVRRGEYEATHDLDSLQDRLAAPERADVATGDDFRAALADVPENQRRALLLREWRGLSYDEIGTELGLSQSATEALLFRARQNVAQRLSQRLGARTLNGASLVAFIRNLLQTAGAKTAAVGAGAALTLAAVPAAAPQAHHSQQPVSAPVQAALPHGKRPIAMTPARPQRPKAAPSEPVRRPAPRNVSVTPNPVPVSSPVAAVDAPAQTPAAAQPPPPDSAAAPSADTREPVSAVGGIVQAPPLPREVAALDVPLPQPVQDVADGLGVQVQVTTPVVSVELP